MAERAARTHCKKGHALDDNYRDGDGYRICRVCKNARHRRSRELIAAREGMPYRPRTTLAGDSIALSVADRFWQYVQKSETCWTWLAKTTRGYGALKVDGRLLPAHRLSWLIHFGEIPDHLCVLHKCDNPPCVNPDHLFLGTYKDNAEDMWKKGRAHLQKARAAKL